MSDDPSHRPPIDRKAQLEDELVARAREPYRAVLAEDEQEGMRIFLNLFVKTHPAMQAMVARRLNEDAVPQDGQSATEAASRPVPAESAVLPRESTVGLGGATLPDVDGSGVVPKDGARAAKDKAGGER